MNAGPVGSEYPGTPFAVILAILFSVLLGKALLSIFRRRRGGKTSQSDGADVVVAVGAALLLVMVLWAIWIHK